MIVQVGCICHRKNPLYISGTTGKDGSITRDILDDLIHLPSRSAENTEKYKDAIKMLEQKSSNNETGGT